LHRLSGSDCSERAVGNRTPVFPAVLEVFGAGRDARTGTLVVMAQALARHRADLGSKFRVKSLALFGSVARGDGARVREVNGIPGIRED
jgi:hypothetical protein